MLAIFLQGNHILIREGGLSYGIDPVDNPNHFAVGSRAGVAVQPHLGLWPERRRWFAGRHSDYSAASQSVLS